jgi:glycosyltransferase involved in cell wall biosynthesis
MVGYGKLLFESLVEEGLDVKEHQITDVLSRFGKQGKNLDQFLLTPPRSMLLKKNTIAHAVDPGNAVQFLYANPKIRSITVHDTIPFLAQAGELDGFSPSALGKKLLAIIESEYHKADGIVAASHATKNDLIDLLGVRPDKIHVIQNAVFQNLAPANKETIEKFRQKYHLIGKRFILNIGKNFYKNRRGVIRVYEKIIKASGYDLDLVFASPRPETQFPELANLDKNKVHFLPWVDEDDMSALYTAAELLLFPSIYEGFGYPVLEAQMCGTPVIASNSGALREVMGDGLTFDVANENAMAEESIKILLDNQYRNDVASRGFQNAKRFQIEEWKLKYKRYFESLIKEAPKRVGTLG